jgi:hypothetical protein
MAKFCSAIDKFFFCYRPCDAGEASTCDREGGPQHKAQTSRQDLI